MMTQVITNQFAIAQIYFQQALKEPALYQKIHFLVLAALHSCILISWILPNPLTIPLPNISEIDALKRNMIKGAVRFNNPNNVKCSLNALFAALLPTALKFPKPIKKLVEQYSKLSDLEKSIGKSLPWISSLELVQLRYFLLHDLFQKSSLEIPTLLFDIIGKQKDSPLQDPSEQIDIIAKALSTVLPKEQLEIEVIELIIDPQMDKGNKRELPEELSNLKVPIPAQEDHHQELDPESSDHEADLKQHKILALSPQLQQCSAKDWDKLLEYSQLLAEKGFYLTSIVARKENLVRGFAHYASYILKPQQELSKQALFLEVDDKSESINCCFKDIPLKIPVADGYIQSRPILFLYSNLHPER